MLTLAENVIVAGADNRPLMLDMTQYSSWASRMLLYIKGKENGKLLVDSVLNGPFTYGTVIVPETPTIPATVRDRTYDELTNAEKICKACDIKATNIILQGLPQDIYNLVNHHDEAKHIWDRVKLLIEGSKISLQERESKLYDEFDTFTSEPGETIHSYYLSQNEASLLRMRSSESRSNAIITGVNINGGTNITDQAKAICCYNCQEGGHVARQCTKPKRPRNSTWFKEKMMLAEAFELGVVLDEEQMEFLADNGDIVTISQASQEIPTPTGFQTDDLDAFDSDCDEALSANNHVIDQNVQETQYSKQPLFNNDTDIDITSDSNMILYEQYLKETENTVVQDTSSSAQQDPMIMFVIEEMTNQVAKCNEVIVDKNAKVAKFEYQIHSLKLQLNATVKSHKTLSTTVDVLKMESKEKEDKYLEEIIKLENKKTALDSVVYKMGQSTQTMHMLTKPQVFYDECHKTTLGYQNPLYLTQAQRKVHTLYCGHAIVKQHDALFVIDTKETLELTEESRLKMHAKQNDPIEKEKKVNISPIDYVALNKLSKHFVKHFVPQKQLYAKQAFWLPISKPVPEIPPVHPEPVLKEIPHELPPINLV
ncbi:retrovirus-related pol polyprotein from transposon TNT 1-94 [Tanacetum coccineum]